MANNTTLNGNNTILGGKEMEGLNVAKLEGFKAIGLEGLYKMAAFNTGLMSDPEFLAAIAELQGQTVMSQKAEGTNADNKEGGNTMKNKETKQAETKAEETTKTKESKGGNKMKKETKTVGGTKMERVYKLSAAEEAGYFQTIKNLLDKTGERAILELEEIGVKVAVISYKEYKTLKDLAYRIVITAGVEMFKSCVDNDALEALGSAVQVYQVVRGAHDIYKIYRAYNNVTLKDVEALDDVVRRINEEANAKLTNEEEDC